MDYTLFLIPLALFIVISGIMYYILKPEQRTDTKVYGPGLIVAVVVFLLLKYKDKFGNNDEMMFGDYFD